MAERGSGDWRPSGKQARVAVVVTSICLALPLGTVFASTVNVSAGAAPFSDSQQVDASAKVARAAAKTATPAPGVPTSIDAPPAASEGGVGTAPNVGAVSTPPSPETAPTHVTSPEPGGVLPDPAASSPSSTPTEDPIPPTDSSASPTAGPTGPPTESAPTLQPQPPLVTPPPEVPAAPKPMDCAAADDLPDNALQCAPGLTLQLDEPDLNGLVSGITIHPSRNRWLGETLIVRLTHRGAEPAVVALVEVTKTGDLPVLIAPTRIEGVDRWTITLL